MKKNALMEASMKKHIIIGLATAFLLSVGVVNSTANFTGPSTVNQNSNDQINTKTIVAYNSLKKSDNTAMDGSTLGNSPASLSMLMIGFVLAGLASYRESNRK
jgi:hypothetical protein